jgi:DNA polymerase-4
MAYVTGHAFTQITRARTGERPFLSAREIEETISPLLQPVFPPAEGVRLLGVTYPRSNR